MGLRVFGQCYQVKNSAEIQSLQPVHVRVLATCVKNIEKENLKVQLSVTNEGLLRVEVFEVSSDASRNVGIVPHADVAQDAEGRAREDVDREWRTASPRTSDQFEVTQNALRRFFELEFRKISISPRRAAFSE